MIDGFDFRQYVEDFYKLTKLTEFLSKSPFGMRPQKPQRPDQNTPFITPAAAWPRINNIANRATNGSNAVLP